MIASEGMGTGCADTIFRDEPSEETVEAIETSLVMIADARKLNYFTKRYPRLIAAHNKVLQRMLDEAVQRIRFYTTLTPEERFLKVQREHPSLIKRVPQKYLASYLGMHPGSLSRIKARLQEKEK